MALPLDSQLATGPYTTNFDFQMGTRIVFGPDRVDELGQVAATRGAKRVLIVSDPGIVEAGHVQRGLESLEASHLESVMFDGARENPTTKEVDAGLEVARDFGPDLIVGLGGGSSMDCAKGINFLYSNGGRMQDYWGVGKAQKPMLPMIAVPTTAGTGSELQSFALISDPDTHAKMACGDKKATCFAAILDPNLTMTQPASVTALTGIDAISHALETFVTLPRNPVSLTFSRQAWQWLCRNFPRVLAEPSDVEARGAVQLGASMAGLAIENSMLGVAHALANPLTAHYDVAHGQAVGLMLVHVIRFNAQVVGDAYAELERLLPRKYQIEDAPAGESLAAWLRETLKRAGLVTSLQELGVAASKLPRLAADANKQWTKGFNPRSIEETDLFSLYQAAF